MWRKRYERSTCDVSYRYRLVSIRQRVTMTMALAWKTNDLHTASLRRPPWPRIAEAYRENEPSPRMNNAWANAVSVSKLLSKIGLSFYLSLSLSFGGPGLMILPGNPRRMKRGRGRDEGEGERKGRAGISVSSRWNRAENGKSSDLVTNGWSTVGWSLASNRCVRIGKGEGKGRPSLRGEYTTVIANEKVLFLRNFYKFILRACVLFASHSRNWIWNVYSLFLFFLGKCIFFF